MRPVQYDLFIHRTPFPESPQRQTIYFLESNVVPVIECGILFMRCCRQNRQAFVEFVFSPQHETSCDPETTTKEDADH